MLSGQEDEILWALQALDDALAAARRQLDRHGGPVANPPCRRCIRRRAAAGLRESARLNTYQGANLNAIADWLEHGNDLSSA